MRGHSILLCCDRSSEPVIETVQIRGHNVWLHCDLSSELSHRDGSDERSKHMISIRNKKNYSSYIIKSPLI